MAIAAALAVVVVTVLLVLQSSSRALSSDGTFSVQIPTGWAQFTARSLPDGTPSTDAQMVLLGPISDGVQARLVITSGLDQPTCGLTLAATRATATTRTTVAGATATVTDCRTSTVGVEVITVNHGNHRYAIAFTSASGEFDRLRIGAIHDVLASWRWN